MASSHLASWGVHSTVAVRPASVLAPVLFNTTFARLCYDLHIARFRTRVFLHCPPFGRSNFLRVLDHPRDTTARGDNGFATAPYRSVKRRLHCLSCFNAGLLKIFYFPGRHSSVGIAARYGLDGPGIETQWGRDFPHPSRPGLGPTQPPIQWAPSLSRGYSGRGVVLTTHPHLAPRLKNE